ncbi:MAG: hypothetical protein KF740_00380 [Ramlibacter sp.]|nr:hypothetical protein [Ramlibacter sp.]
MKNPFATFLLALGGLLACSGTLFCTEALAQGIRREAPAEVKRGELVITQPPEVTLDGKPDRLSPGARIRNTQNLLVLSGSVVGQTLPVVYRRDSAGLIHEVWVLTADEASRLEGANGPKAMAELLALIFGARR